MTDSRGRKMEDRGQRTEDGRRRTEDRRQRTGSCAVLRPPFSVLGFLVLSAGGLVGCGQNLPQRQYYSLQAQPPAGAAPGGPGRGVLLVQPFNVDAAFAGRQMVYRVSEFRYETDYYHQYLIAPGEMLSEKTRDWLAHSGLFQQVIAPGGVASSTWTLTGNVSALYGDFADPKAPQAVLEIRFSLLGTPQTKEPILLAQTYRATNPVADRTADAVIGALDQDFTQILAQLETDLKQRLGEAAKPGS